MVKIGVDLGNNNKKNKKSLKIMILELKGLPRMHQIWKKNNKLLNFSQNNNNSKSKSKRKRTLIINNNNNNKEKIKVNSKMLINKNKNLKIKQKDKKKVIFNSYVIFFFVYLKNINFINFI